MHGNLEPDEDIMSDRNWVTETVMTVPEWTGDIFKALSQLGWEPGDEIDVEIGGTAVSGIDVGEEYNKKWQSPIGTRKYNKDAFIIIKNQSRRDLSKSQPNPDLKAHHA